MRILSTTIIFALCTLLIGCSGGSQINGRSLKAANRSVSMIRNRLPTEQRIEFEVSYWTLRDAIRNNKQFLDTVDGATPEELIVQGKEIFQERKNAGFKNYGQYQNWNQMIAKFTQERLEQNKQRVQPDERDRVNGVNYKL